MHVSLTEEQLESLECILSDEKSRCINTLRSLDGLPDADDQVVWWKNELDGVLDLMAVFRFDCSHIDD
jgi:hypothetical protein